MITTNKFPKRNVTHWCVTIKAIKNTTQTKQISTRGGSRISSQGVGALTKIALSGGRCEHFWGISLEKSRFYTKKSYFFQI
jgi:hypothetical protein